MLTQIAIPVRPQLSEKEFSSISTYIHSHYGIKLPVTKLVLVESRLVQRLTKLNFSSYKEYVNFIFSNEGLVERNNLIDYISTNKTDFFRENAHFKFLSNYIVANKVTKSLNIWSSACSSGEEPYTISMVLEEMKNNGLFNGSYSLLGTDISNTILVKAMRGEYQEKSIENMPDGFLRKYFTSTNGIATANASIRKSLSLKKFNLIDPHQYLTIPSTFDFIFCRNVLIYFDYATQQMVLDNLIKKLAPGGFLFLGHSEALFNKSFPVVQIQPTIYQKIHA